VDAAVRGTLCKGASGKRGPRNMLWVQLRKTHVRHAQWAHDPTDAAQEKWHSAERAFEFSQKGYGPWYPRAYLAPWDANATGRVGRAGAEAVLDNEPPVRGGRHPATIAERSLCDFVRQAREVLCRLYRKPMRTVDIFPVGGREDVPGQAKPIEADRLISQVCDQFFPHMGDNKDPSWQEVGQQCPNV